MTDRRALTNLFDKADADYFKYHLDRKAHIRNPFVGENEAEFQTLGYHERNRRRILLCRVDFEGKPLPKNQVMKIPFLAFSDETVEDRDDILLPIINEIMYGEKREDAAMSWMQPVLFSSNVQEVGYDDQAKGMVVVWKSGKRSLYEGVDEETAAQCSKAASVGSYLNNEIKPNYSHRYI